MAAFPGFGDRITQRLVALGYARQGRPDIARFIREHGYDPRSFYPWANNNRVPRFETLIKLAADLKTLPSWLLLGERAGTPGASAVGDGADGDSGTGERTVRNLRRTEALRHLETCFTLGDERQQELLVQVLKAHAAALPRSEARAEEEAAAPRRPFRRRHRAV